MQWPWSRKACKRDEDVPMRMTASVLDSQPEACSTSLARPMEVASRSSEVYSERESSCLGYSPSDEGLHSENGSDSLFDIFMRWIIKRTKSCISHSMEHGGFLHASGKGFFSHFLKPDVQKHEQNDGEDWYRSHIYCGDRVIDGRLMEPTLEAIEELPEPEERH